ncbi:Unspecific monooxygenase, partial [Trichostrongylus colubriformis]
TKRLTRDEIAAQCFVFASRTQNLVGGFDTTASSLAFCTYLLAKNPQVQKDLQDEIDQYCNTESINYETLASMKYLDVVMKEALRIYPLASIANSRCCMKPTTLGGISIEEGVYVVADTMSLHFDREIWGDDADEFRPERWIESPERPSAAFLSFGLGPRQCVGMRLAHMEEKLVLAHVLQRYDIVATEDTEV